MADCPQGRSVAGALSRIKELAEQHPSLSAAFLFLLHKEHKAAVDKLLQEPRTDTAIRALTNVKALVFWLHTIGHGPTQEVSKHMLAEAEAGALSVAETRLRTANAAVEAAAAQSAARLKGVEDELIEARLALALAQSSLGATRDQRDAAEQRASSAEAEVLEGRDRATLLVNHADGLLQEAGDEAREAQRAAEAGLEALDKVEVALASTVLAALRRVVQPELSASLAELSLSAEAALREADADAHVCPDDIPTHHPLVPEGAGEGAGEGAQGWGGCRGAP